MMKKIATFLLLPVLFVGAFSFIPITLSNDEVVEGYRTTTQFCGSSTYYTMYMNRYEEVLNADSSVAYANTVRGNIVNLGVSLSEKYGNGGSASYRPEDARKVGQFRYSLSMTGGKRVGYNSFDDMRNQIINMKKNSSATGYVSCCAFATFCWDAFLQGDSFYITICELAVHNYFQDIIEGDGTLDYIKAHAKPGDLIFYTNRASDVGKPPPKATTTAGNIYTHVELLIGPYTGTNAKGESYSFEWAAVGSNQPTMRRDVCIKNLDQTVGSGSSHKAAYMVSLDKWIECGYTPVSMSDASEYASECPP